MALLFRDRVLGGSKRQTSVEVNGTSVPRSPPASDLSSPFGELLAVLSESEIRITAYEIFVAACRTSTGKPLTRSASDESTMPSLQRSLTSTAASRMKQALGLKYSGSESNRIPFVKEGSPSAKGKKPATLGELIRVQMNVSEALDSRVRRALLRMSAGQIGRRIESVVLPLEFLQQLKSSEFSDDVEYIEWQRRNLKLLEAGLILHPHKVSDRSDSASQRLQQFIRAAMAKPIETGRNNESMQVLRSAVISVSRRSNSGMNSDICHWADGLPLSLRLYEMLLEACFDVSDNVSLIDEVDELIEFVKNTWGILGLNQMLHNLCFSWVLFRRFVATGQTENDLLHAANIQLEEVGKNARAIEEQEHSKILKSTLSSMLGWAEKRLLAYHDTFSEGNIESMQSIVSLSVSAAKILAVVIPNDYRRKRRGEVDVARDRVDAYIRSSLRTAFAQKMEKADSNRRASKNKTSPLPVLAILAKNVGELASNEKEVFSRALKRWHPFAAGAAVATLHACYGNEIRQFISSITELTPDAVEVLKAADKLEKDLVQIAVEDSVDSEDGGKAIIREMAPYEAESTISNLVKEWINTRLDRVKEWVDRNMQQEAWKSSASKEGYAPSAVETLRLIDETLDAFFQLPIPMHPTLLPVLVSGLDNCVQYYISKAKSYWGTRNSFIPPMPPLTRCTVGSKLWKRREKIQTARSSQVANGYAMSETPQICLCINSLLRLRAELDVVEKRIITLLRNTESATANDFSRSTGKKFELSNAAVVEAVRQISDVMAYKIVFHDLKHVLWDGLYVGQPSSSRIDPVLREIERNLMIVSETLHERARTRVITDIMRASFDGFLLVLLVGGPSRAFNRNDAQMVEEDFNSLRELFWADGDGLPMDVLDKFSGTVRTVLPLLRTDSESLVERFRQAMIETYGSSGKSKTMMPPTSGQWSPTEPNTLLRLLCYRNDEVASKFLKKTYNLPKKL